MAFCFHCGAELKDGAKFCTKCGKKTLEIDEKPTETIVEPDEKVNEPVIDTEDSLLAENVVESEPVVNAEITDTNSSQETTDYPKQGTWHEPVQQPTQNTTGYYYGNPVPQPVPKQKKKFNTTILIIVISALGALSSVSNFNIVSLLIALIQLALGIVLLLEEKELVKLPPNFLKIPDDKRKQFFTTIALILIIPFVISTSVGNSISSHKSSSSDSSSYSEKNDDSNDTINYTSEDELTIKYNVMDNGKVEIIGYEGDGKTATINSEYEDKKVVRIADNAFKDCDSLEDITIWADIEEFGESSFENCTKLKEISISSKAKKIGANAFKNCTSLEDVTIWGSPDIGEYAFSGCNKIKDVSISSGTKNIGAYAFENCTGITDLSIWGVDIIWDYAFYGCSGIKEVSIPSDVKSIGNHTFDGCTSLTEVTIWSDDTAIGTDAFANCPNLKEVPAARGTVPKYTGTVHTTENTTEKAETTTKKETTIKKETTTKEKSVDYSTNNYDDAKEGNKGVYSYKSKGGTYDVYWIIDLDENYVYMFTEGNDDQSCDRGTIVSGTLNDSITARWNMDGEKYDWNLNFKYKNTPTTLVVTDHYGISTEFWTTNLNEALAKKSERKLYKH